MVIGLPVLCVVVYCLIVLIIELAICDRAHLADRVIFRRLLTMTDENKEVFLRPPVGTELMGQGRVIIHQRVLDSLGRFHGLLRLVVEKDDGAPDPETWKGMLLTSAVVHYAWPDAAQPGRLTILYELPGAVPA